MRGISRSAASSMAAWTSSSGRLTLTRPAWTMRASGALAAEHIFTALATSPARMHFCIVARNTSLLIDAPKRESALSTMTPMVMMDQKRITYIPQPPSLKFFQTAAIERPPLERESLDLEHPSNPRRKILTQHRRAPQKPRRKAGAETVTDCLGP